MNQIQTANVASDVAELARRKAMLAAIIVSCIGAFVLSADTGLASVALPKITADLSISGGDSSWVNNAFMLALASFLIMFGRLADRVGIRRVFVGGCVLAAFAALGCGLAPNSGVLFASRALQGIAGAMILASGLGAILAVTRNPADRATGMAAWGMANASAVATGFVLGGLISDQFGWEWVFIANAPILLGVAVAAARILPGVAPDARRRGLDIPGSILTITGSSLLLLGCVKSIDWGWGDTKTLALLGAGAVLLVGFVIVERFSKDPLIPHKAFRQRNVAAGHLAVFMATGATSGIVVTVLYLEPVLGHTAVETGLMLMPNAIGGILISYPAAQLARRFGPKFTVPAGLAVAAGSMFWLSQVVVAEGGSYGTVAVPVTLLGMSVAWTIVTGTMAASEAFAKNDAAVSSGTVNAFGHIGGAVMVAVLFTTMFTWFYDHLSPYLLESQEQGGGGGEEGEAMPPFIAIPWVEGQVHAYRVGAVVLAVAAVVICAWLTNRRPSHGIEGEGEEVAVMATPAVEIPASPVH